MTLVMAALLLLPALAWQPVPSVAAQGGDAPWWGPSNRADPTDGWAFRVPVVVKNDFSTFRGDGNDNPVLRSWPVSVEIDLGELLEDAGWTARNGVPLNFELDVDSIRVIEYENGFRKIRNQEPVPHTFHPATFEGDANGQRFDAATNPRFTVSWILEGPLQLGQERSYYVYFHAKQYGDHEPLDVPARDRAGIDNLHNGALGTVFYGYEHGATGNDNTLEITGFHDDTWVTIYEYVAGTPQMHEPNGGLKNPMQINASEAKRYVLPSNSLFKIASDKPILVTGHGSLFQDGSQSNQPASLGGGGYVPPIPDATHGTDGYRGTRFLFPLTSPGVWVVNTATESATVNLFQCMQSGCFNMQQTVTLSSANPLERILDTTDPQTGQVVSQPSGNNPETTGVQWYEIRVTDPNHPGILVFQGDGSVQGVHPLMSLEGGPAGTEFYGLVPPRGSNPGESQSSDGFYGVTTFQDTRFRVIHPETRALLFPQADTLDDAPPARIQPGIEGARAYPVNDTIPPNEPLRFWSSAEPAHVPETGRGEFLMNAGRGPRIGHYPGIQGSTYVAEDPATIVAYHNETRATVVATTASTCYWQGRCDEDVQTETTSISLNQDGLSELRANDPPGTETRYLIETDKPLAVFSRDNADYYARFVPGKLPNPSIDVGKLEFRGPLVALSSASQPGQTTLAGDTGPERPVEFKLRVRNLGQWIGGGNLDDTYTITCEGVPSGWTVEGCGHGDQPGPTYNLQSRASSPFSVFVTPPADADPSDDARITVRATSNLANVTATLNLYVIVKVEFGVGLWFDFVNGPREVETYHDPGQEARLSVAVQNTGSVQDDVTVTVSQMNEWLVDLRSEDTATTPLRLRLAPGETRVLQLGIEAPEVPDNNFDFITVTARSAGSENEVAQVRAKSFIRPDLDFALELDRASKVGNPGETITFNASVENRGDSPLQVFLSVDNSTVPENWTATFDVETFDLFPGQTSTRPLVVQVPDNALAGELATVQIEALATTQGGETREPGEARVLVRHLHNVTIPPPDELRVRPGDVLEHVLTITNDGNGLEEVELVRSSVRPFWPIQSGLDDTLIIPRDDTSQLPLEITVPEDTPPGPVNLRFDLRLNREADLPVELPLRVETVRELDLEPRTSLRVSPGQPFEFQVEAVNTGNVNATFALEADVPAEWAATFSPSGLTLEPGDSRLVTLRLNASRDAADGNFPLTLRAVPEDGNGPAATRTTQVEVAKPTLGIGEVVAPGNPRNGELYVVEVPVENTGPIDAVNVRVALRVDGEDVDLVTINRVPAGQTARATLKWDATYTPDNVEIVVNPDGSVVTSDAEPVTQFLSVDNSIPAPAPLMASLVAALAGIVLGARRRFRP